MTHNRSTYCQGCRCELCREASRQYEVQRRQKMKSHRDICQHRKWRYLTKTYEACCFCRKTRKKVEVMGVVA